MPSPPHLLCLPCPENTQGAGDPYPLLVEPGKKSGTLVGVWAGLLLLPPSLSPTYCRVNIRTQAKVMVADLDWQHEGLFPLLGWFFLPSGKAEDTSPALAAPPL